MRRNFDPADRARLLDYLLERRWAGESLEGICATPGWPSRPTLRKWLLQDPVRAMLVQAYPRNGPAQRGAGRLPPFDPPVAERLLIRVRLGYPLASLLRDPQLPHRRALDAWKQADADFAAQLAEAKASSAHSRRRHGAPGPDGRARRGRSRVAFDEPTADRIMLAVHKGATLPGLARDPTLPSRTGLRRWRKANPVWSLALESALRTGALARGRARTDAHCTPALTRRIELAIVRGASLHSLSKRRDMPSLTTLYKWVRTRPAFADAIARACEFRDEWCAETACDLVDDQGLAAAPRVRALHKRLGQLNPHPGERRQWEAG